MRRGRHVPAAAVPGIHRALIRSHEAEAEEIDPRLRFMDIEPAELAGANRQQSHSKQMARTAARLRAASCSPSRAAVCGDC